MAKVELVGPDPLGWAERFEALEERLMSLLPSASGNTLDPRLSRSCRPRT